MPADDDVVTIHETTHDTSVNTVEANDGTTSEESVEDETDNTTDTVLGEDIERVVNSDKELDCKMVLVAAIHVY